MSFVLVSRRTKRKLILGNGGNPSPITQKTQKQNVPLRSGQSVSITKPPTLSLSSLSLEMSITLPKQQARSKSSTATGTGHATSIQPTLTPIIDGSGVCVTQTTTIWGSFDSEFPPLKATAFIPQLPEVQAGDVDNSIKRTPKVRAKLPKIVVTPPSPNLRAQVANNLPPHPPIDPLKLAPPRRSLRNPAYQKARKRKHRKLPPSEILKALMAESGLDE